VREGSSSFLQKRSKKLLPVRWHHGFGAVGKRMSPREGRKSFLVLFCKKELFLLLCLLVSAPALAQTAPIDALDHALEAAMKQGSAPFATRYKALAPVVDQVFDLEQILRSSVGLRWASIPPAQQQQLLSVFRAYTICNYAANFDSNSGTEIHLLPEVRSVGADRIVESEIVPKSGDPIRMDYVMRQGAAGWQAVDVLEAGTISQAAVQRSDFRSLLADGPAQLIASLQAKVNSLSGGSISP